MRKLNYQKFFRTKYVNAINIIKIMKSSMIFEFENKYYCFKEKKKEIYLLNKKETFYWKVKGAEK
jgi:hypothetical protein